MTDEIFLIDTNSIITPYQTFYSFDFALGFWKQLKDKIESGKIAILDIVKNEITKNDDELQMWFDSLTITNYVDHRENAILEKYSAILQHIQSNPNYKPSALIEWSRATVADPWLIAAASVYGYTIITFETFNNNLNSHNPSKNAKIPNIADVFNVKTQNLYYLMRKLEITL